MPVRLRGASVRAGNGEAAWLSAVVAEAVAWFIAHDLAIVGGEVYEVLPETQWGTFRGDWVVERADGETWTGFVARSGRVALAEIAVAEPGTGTKVFLAVEACPTPVNGRAGRRPPAGSRR